MDWSRAKNILIATLLVCNIILGSIYFYGIYEESVALKKATVESVNYLESRGLEITSEVPVNPTKIKPVYVSLTKKQEKALKEYKYKNYQIEVKGVQNVYISKIKSGSSKLIINPAYTALFKLFNDVSLNKASGKSMTVNSIEMVYRVDRRDYKEQTGEDTALPYWKVTDGCGKCYYYIAVGE